MRVDRVLLEHHRDVPIVAVRLALQRQLLAGMAFTG
jgi:hypothetical protein